MSGHAAGLFVGSLHWEFTGHISQTVLPGIGIFTELTYKSGGIQTARFSGLFLYEFSVGQNGHWLTVKHSVNIAKKEQNKLTTQTCDISIIPRWTGIRLGQLGLVTIVS